MSIAVSYFLFNIIVVYSFNFSCIAWNKVKAHNNDIRFAWTCVGFRHTNLSVGAKNFERKRNPVSENQPSRSTVGLSLQVWNAIPTEKSRQGRHLRPNKDAFC
jgi:hypothetical protein